MSGNHRHQWPLTSLEKQDSWLSGLLYHVIFFSDLYISHMDCEVNTFRNYFAKNANFEPFSSYFAVFASSYSAIPAATDTLNDSFCPNIGISMISSAKASHSGAIPLISSPSSSATRSGAE